MSNVHRRLERIEKRLGVGTEPYPVNIAAFEMDSDEFAELLREIDGTSKGALPSQDEIREAIAVEDDEKQPKATNSGKVEYQNE